MEEKMKKNMTSVELIGSVLTTDRGIKFKVLEVEDYPDGKISKPYQKIMEFSYGKLVGVNCHGTFVPNITIHGGVVRLTKVLVNGKVYDRAGTISDALGIVAHMTPYDLK